MHEHNLPISDQELTAVMLARHHMPAEVECRARCLVLDVLKAERERVRAWIKAHPHFKQTSLLAELQPEFPEESR